MDNESPTPGFKNQVYTPTNTKPRTNGRVRIRRVERGGDMVGNVRDEI